MAPYSSQCSPLLLLTPVGWSLLMFRETSGCGGMLKEHKEASLVALRRAALEGEESQPFVRAFPEPHLAES